MVSAIRGSTVPVVKIIMVVMFGVSVIAIVAVVVPVPIVVIRSVPVIIIRDHVILVAPKIGVIKLVWIAEVVGVLVTVVRRIQLVVHVQGCGGLGCIAYGYLLWRGASEGECKSQNEQ